MQHKQASLLKTISIYKIIHDWYGVKYTSYFCAAQFLIARKGTTARTWGKGQNWRRKGGNGAALFSAKYTEQRRASGRITLVTLWLNTSEMNKHKCGGGKGTARPEMLLNPIFSCSGIIELSHILDYQCIYLKVQKNSLILSVII